MDKAVDSSIDVEVKRNTVSIRVKTKIFPLEVIYSASYAMLDRAYIFLDGDPNDEIFACFTGKKEQTAEELVKLGRDFNNELINYAVYITQATRNKGLREAIIKRALFTNSAEYDVKKASESKDDEDFLKDPEGIAKPWSPVKTG